MSAKRREHKDNLDRALARGGVLGRLKRQDDAFERRVLIHQMLYGGGFAKVERLSEGLTAKPASQVTIDAMMQQLKAVGLAVSERILRGDVARVRKQRAEAEARTALDGQAQRKHWLIESG
jgi:hypothetical protein